MLSLRKSSNVHSLFTPSVRSVRPSVPTSETSVRTRGDAKQLQRDEIEEQQRIVRAHCMSFEKSVAMDVW